MRLDEYPLLSEKYATKNAFATALSTLFATNDEYVEPSVKSSFTSFVSTIAGAIYNYYKRDRIAYEDKDIFLDRINETISEHINFLFQRRKIELFLGKNTDEGKFTLTTSMETSSNELGKSGSSVVQSYANTPTGVNGTKTGDSISVDIADSNTETELSVTEDSYANKYTNNQTKTNGLRRNEVDKDSDVKRYGNFKNALELFEDFRKYPSFLKSLLTDVSQHFIYIY